MKRPRPSGRVSAVLALFGLLGLALLPAEHVHAREHDGHRAELVHRHFDAHHPVPDQTHVDDDADEDAQYLTALFTRSEPSLDGGRADDSAVPAGVLVRPPLVSQVAPDSPAALGHDPPWRYSLSPRAPPTPLV